ASGFPSRRASMIVLAKMRLRRQEESRSRQTATVILQPQLQSLEFITLRATFFCASVMPTHSTSLILERSVTGACVSAREIAWRANSADKAARVGWEREMRMTE